MFANPKIDCLLTQLLSFRLKLKIRVFNVLRQDFFKINSRKSLFSNSLITYFPWCNGFRFYICLLNCSNVFSLQVSMMLPFQHIYWFSFVKWLNLLSAYYLWALPSSNMQHIFFFSFLKDCLESKPSDLQDYRIAILCNACKCFAFFIDLLACCIEIRIVWKPLKLISKSDMEFRKLWSWSWLVSLSLQPILLSLLKFSVLFLHLWHLACPKILVLYFQLYKHQ